MSNRRRIPRPSPPPELLAYAAAYQCMDCAADVAPVWVRRLGVWSIEVRHDDGCPVLAGTVSRTGAAREAARAARIRPVLYVQADLS